MLTSTVVRLRARQAGSLPSAMGEYGHAAFLALIRTVAPALSQALHDAGTRLPYAVSPLAGGRLQRDRVQVHAGEACRMRFTIIDPAVYAVFSRYFADTVAPHLTLTLGGVEFAIEEASSARGADEWAGYSSFAELFEQAEAEPLITLRFLSPTAFSLGESDGEGSRFGILPDPSLVFDSLLRRWNQFAEQGLGDARQWQAWVREHVVVRRYKAQSELWCFRRHPQVGFVGTCTYEIKGDHPAEARVLNTLADFAFYAGVGRKTAMGMGQCRRVSE